MNFYDILLAKKLSGGGGGDITTEALNVTANGQYTAPQGKAYTPVNVDIKGYKVGEVDVPTDIASFTASDAPLKSLTASIKPVQDLHGYDRPWVGGAGKNKSEKKITEFSYASNVNGSASVSGDILTVTTTSSTHSGVYSILDFVESFTGKCSYSVDVKANTNGNVLIGMTNAGRKNVSLTTNWQRVKFEDVTFDGNSKTFVIYNQGIENTIQVKDFMFELGSVAHDYEPYSNICPISGWTDCEVTVADDTTTPTVEQTYTIPFTDGQGQSVKVFGGEIDVINGVVTPCPYYASYNREQLTGEWISDRDEYAEGTTPTIGAQVVNIGATGTSFSTQPTSIKSLEGVNNARASTGQIEDLEFFEEL